MHRVVAEQFLTYEEGDKIEFIDNDKDHYLIENLKVIKQQLKKHGELIDQDDDFTYFNISKKDYGNFNEEENEKAV